MKKSSNSDFSFFSKPSDVLLLCFIQIIIVPEHKIVDSNIKIVGRYMYLQVYILALVCIHLISTCTLYIRLYNDFSLYGLVFFLEPVLVQEEKLHM